MNSSDYSASAGRIALLLGLTETASCPAFDLMLHVKAGLPLTSLKRLCLFLGDSPLLDHFPVAANALARGRIELMTPIESARAYDIARVLDRLLRGSRLRAGLARDVLHRKQPALYGHTALQVAVMNSAGTEAVLAFLDTDLGMQAA